MTSTIEIPDEFEEFRARSYSGGCRQAMVSSKDSDPSHTNQARSRTTNKSPCPAEFDTSDSEDERGMRRLMAAEGRNRWNRSPSPRSVQVGSSRANPALKVPRTYRARSASPQSSSVMSARTRTRMKVEELRRMMAKKSEDSQDEYYRSRELHRPPFQKRRESGSNEYRSDSGVCMNKETDECPKPTALETRFLSHMSCVVLDADDEIGDMRPRVSTEPTRTLSRLSFRSKVPRGSNATKETRLVHTVRHFTITSKGSVVSQGEYLSKSSTSLGSYESGSTCSASSDDGEDYTVVFVGDPGVGKNALIEKFLPHDAYSSRFTGKLLQPLSQHIAQTFNI